MEMTMRLHHRRIRTIPGYIWSSIVWVFKIVGMMFTVAIGLITALFMSVGTIAALAVFILERFI